jgi:hypothetical protein
MDLKHLTPELIGKVSEFANKSVACIIKAKESEQADESAATSMLELMRDFVSSKADAKTILNTYKYGLKECREAAAKAYDNGEVKAKDRRAAGQTGAGRMTSYGPTLSLLSWAITTDYDLATDAVAPNGHNMTARRKLLSDAFDRALLVSCKSKVKMVLLDDVEWDLEFVEGLKDEDKTLIGFTDSSDTINRALGTTYKDIQHQATIMRIRSRHNNNTLSRWRKELGLPEISGNA